MNLAIEIPLDPIIDEVSPARIGNVEVQSNDNHLSTTSLDDSIIIQVDGRLLLLAKDHFTKSAEYFASVFNAPDPHRDLKNVCKFEVNDLLQQLFPLPQPAKPSLKEIESTKDSMYYLNMAVFEVEGCLFMVPKHSFVESTIFESTSAESDAHPIKLDGVLKTDFQAVLKLLYPLSYNNETNLSQDEWRSVLKLATKWNMKMYHHMAMQNLPPPPPPAERIVFGREYNLIEWVRSGCRDLAARDEPLSVDDFESLGLPTALELSQLARRQYINVFKIPGYKFENPASSVCDRFLRELWNDRLKESTVELDTVDRILLARSCGVFDWFQVACKDLVKRQEDITVGEAERLGLEITAHLCRVKEKFRTKISPAGGFEQVLTDVVGNSLGMGGYTSGALDIQGAQPRSPITGLGVSKAKSGKKKLKK